MIETTAINLTGSERLLVTWDTGRRCNFDCTYCESTRHDNVSALHSYNELLRTFNFIKDYTGDQLVNINFTGGEPTVNKAFWQLAEFINETENRFRLSLTTNGAWHPDYTHKIQKWFEGITVSYHAEGHSILKKQTLDNIKLLHKSDIWLQVNVMMHTDYFDECVSICEELKDLGIRHNPRPIGDGNIERNGWFKDLDGSLRRTSHDYTEVQEKWYYDYLGIDNPKQGRRCCGGRCLKGKVDNNWQDIDFINTNFKGWFCTVNKYFLHIDQHTGDVFYHQTCKAKHDGTIGPIGNLKDTLGILKYVEENKNNTIICPNNRCGCGMCVPKAKLREDFDLIVTAS
jgi:MoaA/NifB/PqqE/SkfB family radical SAM enzyme